MSIPYALIPYYNVSGEEDVIMLGLGLVQISIELES